MRKQYTVTFKTKVAQKLRKEEKMMTQLTAEYEVHPTQLKEWRSRTLEGLYRLFEKHDSSAELRVAHKEQLLECSSSPSP